MTINLDLTVGLTLLVAKGDISERIACLHRGLDRRSASLMKSSFHEDASVDYGVFDGPAMDFCDLMGKDVGPGPVALHRIANQWIKFDDQDHARSETYGVIYSPGIRGHRDGQSMIGGRYLDLHERREAVWRLSYRQFVLDWNVNAPASGSALPGYQSPSVHGTRQGDDPSFAFLASAPPAINSTHLGSQFVEVSEDLIAQAGIAFAKAEIHDLLVAQARATDRADLDLLTSLWTPDATVEVSGFFSGAASDYCEKIVAMSKAVKRIFHALGNELIRIDGDSAVAETYVTAVTTLVTQDGEQDSISGGRYLDRFEMHEGRWRFSSRCFVSDWTMEHPSTDRRDDAQSFYDALKIRGSKYPQDPLYSFWGD